MIHSTDFFFIIDLVYFEREPRLGLENNGVSIKVSWLSIIKSSGEQVEKMIMSLLTQQVIAVQATYGQCLKQA